MSLRLSRLSMLWITHIKNSVTTAKSRSYWPQNKIAACPLIEKIDVEVNRSLVYSVISYAAWVAGHVCCVRHGRWQHFATATWDLLWSDWFCDLVAVLFSPWKNSVVGRWPITIWNRRSQRSRQACHNAAFWSPDFSCWTLQTSQNVFLHPVKLIDPYDPFPVHLWVALCF